MLIISQVSTCGWEPALRGMRNPKNSWDRSDSSYWQNAFHSEEPELGPNDLDLAIRLANGGPVHAKYRRMIKVYCDILAPLYWWKEFDTYKVGTVANSCSTMHKIHSRPLTIDDFAHEHLNKYNRNLLDQVIRNINECREAYIASEMTDKEAWYNMIQMLPSSYLQKRTVEMNYEVLAGMYTWRKNHKLSEWRTFCEFIELLPYAKELILN
jgi:hypothetical protein